MIISADQRSQATDLQQIKNMESEVISQHVKEYMKKGNEITRIPNGVSGINENGKSGKDLMHQYERIYKSGKKTSQKRKRLFKDGIFD